MWAPWEGGRQIPWTQFRQLLPVVTSWKATTCYREGCWLCSHQDRKHRYQHGTGCLVLATPISFPPSTPPAEHLANSNQLSLPTTVSFLHWYMTGIRPRVSLRRWHFSCNAILWGFIQLCSFFVVIFVGGLGGSKPKLLFSRHLSVGQVSPYSTFLVVKEKKTFLYTQYTHVHKHTYTYICVHRSKGLVKLKSHLETGRSFWDQRRSAGEYKNV